MSELELEPGNKPNKKKPASRLAYGLAVGCLAFAATLTFCTSCSPLSNPQYGAAEALNSSQIGVSSPSSKTKLSSVQVAQKVCPSVVGIVVQGEASISSIFGTYVQEIAAAGSGFVVNKNGYIATNAHVVKGAKNIEVFLDGDSKSSYPAKIVAMDEVVDLAVIQITDTLPNLPPVTLGNSNALLRGEKVYVIGNPLGPTFSGSITQGIVSGKNRRMTPPGSEYTFDYYIQTDASVDHGNSGGVMVNESGEVVGVITLGTGNASNIGIAIPINEASKVISEIIKNKKVSHPTLGISGVDINERIQQAYGVPAGVSISSIATGSCLSGTAAKVNDIIVKANSTEISGVSDLRGFLAQKVAKDVVTIKLYRPSTHKYLEVSVKLK